MAGNTATINLQAFRADWESHMPYSAMCVRYSVTRDQVIRLRDVWGLQPRTDCKLRWKPKRSEYRPPTRRQIRAACLRIQATWDENTREQRRVRKTDGVQLPFIRLADMDTADDDGAE